MRKAILDIVLAAGRPVGAYDVLTELSRVRGKVAPPTVYRALDYLLQEHLIHRVHCLNAFVACNDCAKPHLAELLICRDCGQTREVVNERFEEAVAADARQEGFKPESIVLEVQGQCADCRSDRA